MLSNLSREEVDGEFPSNTRDFTELDLTPLEQYQSAKASAVFLRGADASVENQR